VATVTAFLSKIGLKPYGTVTNSWDAFSESGSVLMQLWSAPGQRVRNYPVPGAYLRVRCFDAEHYHQDGENKRVGYNGRTRAIQQIEAGAKGYAAISSSPNNEHGPGSWAKHADLTRVYPILKVEHMPDSGDIYVVLGTPVSIEDIE
jgi:hypothetical protein